MRVVIGLSGGVDSAVSAALLIEQGHEVVGLYLALHDAGDPSPAQAVADHLGIPLVLGAARDAFDREVILPWADGYLAGETPNPCARCNATLKFPALHRAAERIGADLVATGHYARAQGGQLFAGADPRKDQSYFLSLVPGAVLARVLFPLGGLTKPEVRAMAERLHLPVAHRPESQEICFVPPSGHAAYLRQRFPELGGDGAIVDTAGRELGRHDGYFRFTEGQRRGHGVAMGAPAYVVGVDPVSHRVTLSTDQRLLLRDRLRLVQPNWYRRPADGDPFQVRVRHGGALIPASFQGKDGLTVQLAHPVRAVVPGQLAALYQGDRVCGAGWIAKEV
ncbi:MAG: tRNA 2-thiouridine(34) synthase MnmA [Deltaproteobacteria bacterium]|nr:tRNA 2-thiouridine(34) synthase MnmA [Deltaproteobacteria bacterium]